MSLVKSTFKIICRKKWYNMRRRNNSLKEGTTSSKTCNSTNNHLTIPCSFKKLTVEVGTPIDVNEDPFVLSIYGNIPVENCSLRNDFLKRLDKLAYEKTPYPKPHLPPSIYN